MHRTVARKYNLVANKTCSLFANTSWRLVMKSKLTKLPSIMFQLFDIKHITRSLEEFSVRHIIWTAMYSFNRITTIYATGEISYWWIDCLNTPEGCRDNNRCIEEVCVVSYSLYIVSINHSTNSIGVQCFEFDMHTFTSQ